MCSSVIESLKYIIAVKCPEIEEKPEFSLSSPTNRSYMDVITISCADELRTYDGRTEISIECLSSAKWSFSQTFCLRMSSL